MMRSEGFLELFPSETSVRGEHCHMIIPPCACWAPKLLSGKSCLVPIIVLVQGEFGLDSPKPAVCLQRFIRFMEERWLSSQKLWISRSRRLMVMSRLRRSALRHELTEECRLLIAPSEHGRNGLGQLRRVRWFSHSAFNHDEVSSIIQINQDKTDSN
jgi:hypothetical protein